MESYLLLNTNKRQELESAFEEAGFDFEYKYNSYYFEEEEWGMDKLEVEITNILNKLNIGGYFETEIN